MIVSLFNVLFRNVERIMTSWHGNPIFSSFLYVFLGRERLKYLLPTHPTLDENNTVLFSLSSLGVTTIQIFSAFCKTQAVYLRVFTALLDTCIFFCSCLSFSCKIIPMHRIFVSRNFHLNRLTWKTEIKYDWTYFFSMCKFQWSIIPIFIHSLTHLKFCLIFSTSILKVKLI